MRSGAAMEALATLATTFEDAEYVAKALPLFLRARLEEWHPEVRKTASRLESSRHSFYFWFYLGLLPSKLMFLITFCLFSS